MVSTFYFSYDDEGHTFYESAKSLIYNTPRIEDCYVFIGDTTKEKIEEDEEAYDDNYRGEGVIEYLAKKETDAHKQKGMKEAYKKQNKKQSATIKKLRAEIEELKHTEYCLRQDTKGYSADEVQEYREEIEEMNEDIKKLKEENDKLKKYETMIYCVWSNLYWVDVKRFSLSFKNISQSCDYYDNEEFIKKELIDSDEEEEEEQMCIGIKGKNGCDYSSFTYQGCNEGWGVKNWKCSKCKEEEEEQKEEFYKQKIQEAKDKKIKSVYYKGKEFKFKAKWDELLPEIYEMIINYKEQIEFVDGACGSDYKKEGYMLETWKKYDITGKSVCDYLFTEYKNENGERLTRCFSPTWYLSKFLWCMINNKSMVDEKYHHKFKSKDIELDRKNMKITKNKAPSLEELIVFRTKQKKEQSEKRKAKNKEKAKEKDEELKKLSKYKIGDLVCDYEKYGTGRTALRIIGETKTQYKVEEIEWTYEGNEMDGYYCIYYYGLSFDESIWKTSKHKNIGKKSYFKELQVFSRGRSAAELQSFSAHRCPTDDDLYYVESGFDTMN